MPCASCGELYSPPVPAGSPSNVPESVSELASLEQDNSVIDNMLVTNLLSLPNIKETHGLVTAYYYTMSTNPKQEELLVGIEATKKMLIKRIKNAAHKMGGNAIVGFTLDIKIDHSTYLSTSMSIGGAGAGMVSVLSGVSINVYGTAVTLEKTTG